MSNKASSNPFPTQLSELTLSDPSTTQSIYTTIKQLKKTTLSLHNRLRSILTDATYIDSIIHPSFPDLPLVANERCGSWYIPPALKAGSAYFKSTDGHYGYWDFSLRRLNLQVLEMIGRSGGAVLVDSTRRGKRMPDALRRTVPVWVVVWNRILFGDWIGAEGWEWAFEVQHPGLEPGEVRLIESRIDDWVHGLKGLDLDLDGVKKKLARPMRLCWVVQGEQLPEIDERFQGHQRYEYNLFVLCSASRRVIGAEMSEDGYVQGAADDAEGWSGGLTSRMFWAHKDEIMVTPEEELPELISELIESEKAVGGKIDAVQIEPTQNIFVAAQSILHDGSTERFDLIVRCNEMPLTDKANVVSLACNSGKKGSRDLRDKLPLAMERVQQALAKNTRSKILIVCANGKDLSIGVAVMLLCSLYDDEGKLAISQSRSIDKQLVKKRLAWITSIKPDANPSRSTLQAVNTFLM